jgi:hypothetical protein
VSWPATLEGEPSAEELRFVFRSGRLCLAFCATVEVRLGFGPTFAPLPTVSIRNCVATRLRMTGMTTPTDNLLVIPYSMPMGTTSSRPVALKRAGLTLKDMDLVEMHEAFAAQVLSNLKGFESQAWAERAGFSQPVGEVDRAKLNVMGGSIAIGHPFGATGARITTTLLNELRRRGGQFGLMTVCSAGGMGFAMVVERTR